MRSGDDRKRDRDSAETDSLLVLMQDRDGVTRSLVRDRLCALGWNAVNYCFCNLERVIPEGEGRAMARSFLRDVSSSYSVRELEDLLRKGSFFVPDGLYLLTRIMMPELTPGGFHDCYMDPAGDLVCELRDTMTAVEKVEMLNYIVFDRYGFQLSYDMSDGYGEVVLIPDVMESRRAGVVGISAVYFLLAAYAGLPVYPVFPRMPGYYVAYFEGARTLFSMDMGDRGRISDPVPRRLWLDTAFMGTDQTILYLYANALRRFGSVPLLPRQAALLDRALDLLRL